jgi:hypothetical protein
MNGRLLVLAWWLPVIAACGSDTGRAAGAEDKAQSQAGSGSAALEPGQAPSDTAVMVMTPQPAAEPPPLDDPNTFRWSTESFSVDAEQEKYLCYAKTLDEDLVINSYKSTVGTFVHHLILSRARKPETEGFSECDVAFKSNWETIFISGAGSSTLEFPSDAGVVLKKGTQLVLQMHLLNTRDTPVDGSVIIDMTRSSVENPRPVSSYIFGTAAVELPPMQQTDVVGTCAVRQPVHLIAGFPHMHLLGSAMRFEVGPSKDALQEVFKRDPFEFGNQSIDKLAVTLTPGNVTRVTCTFNNTKDQTVSYGESTLNEMCYFIGFAVDLPAQSACLEVIPKVF